VATNSASIDDYIAALPRDVQEILQEVRRTLHEAVPGSGETISYQMPTITVNGRSLVYFAGWKKHVGMYPIPEGDADFDRDSAPYRAVQSTLRFPYSKPIPYDLIARMAVLLVNQRDGDRT
jgi:uncharacterized protein YdhG (YjbR/CyaY superfamily)